MVVYTCTKPGHKARIVPTRIQASEMLKDGYMVVARKVNHEGRIVKSWQWK